MSFAPDTRTLASAGLDRVIKVWRASDGALLRDDDGECGTGVLSLTHAPSGRRITFGRMGATLVTVRNPFVMQQAVPVEP